MRSCLLTPLLLATLFGTCQAAGQSGIPRCHQATIPFDTSTLIKIVTESDSVVAAGDDFWKGEQPLIYAQGWADEVGSRNAYSRFHERVSELASLSADERAAHELSQMTATLIARQEEWRQKALPHICSYLPAGIDLSRPAYFVAFIPPRAFATSEGIVIDVAAKYWHGNPDNVLNMLIHEFFHVGYGQTSSLRSEEPLEDKQVYKMLEMVQNEGLAVWVAHEGLSFFPAPDERDNRLLDDPEEVTQRLMAMNDLLARAGETEEKEFQRLAWRVGVTDRTYYITGAHMARIIEAERDRDALVGTLLKGPLSFVELYNSLVSEERRVRLPE